MAEVDSLWYEVKARGRSNVLDVTLRRCLNCGEVKVLSNPCGFDHLAALMEFRDHKIARTDDHSTWPGEQP